MFILFLGKISHFDSYFSIGWFNHQLISICPNWCFLHVGISYHIISFRIISFHVHIISYHIISYHIISYHIIYYHIISYQSDHLIIHLYIYIYINVICKKICVYAQYWVPGSQDYPLVSKVFQRLCFFAGLRLLWTRSLQSINVFI